VLPWSLVERSDLTRRPSARLGAARSARCTGASQVEQLGERMPANCPDDNRRWSDEPRLSGGHAGWRGSPPSQTPGAPARRPGQLFDTAARSGRSRSGRLCAENDCGPRGTDRILGGAQVRSARLARAPFRSWWRVQSFAKYLVWLGHLCCRRGCFRLGQRGCWGPGRYPRRGPAADPRSGLHRSQHGIVRLFSVWGGRVVFTRDVALRRPGSGGCGHADDLVPGGESGVHLVAVTGCGESVSAGPKVR
jgi:hypothetical protein